MLIKDIEGEFYGERVQAPKQEDNIIKLLMVSNLIYKYNSIPKTKLDFFEELNRHMPIYVEE